MVQTLKTGKGVSFSKIFSNKKCLAAVFPSDIYESIRLVKKVICWTHHFQTLDLVFPKYQKKLYETLISEENVKVAALEDFQLTEQHDLLLLLSSNRRAQKFADGKGNRVVLGHLKKTNVRFIPPPDNPFDLCKKFEELMNIQVSKSETLLDIAKLTDTVKMEQAFSGTFQKHSYLLDINSFLKKLRIMQMLKKTQQPYSYLLHGTDKPHKKSRQTTISGDSVSHRFSVMDLWQLIQYCRQTEIIVTDNESFFELLSELKISKKTVLWNNRTSHRKIRTFLNI